MSLPSPPWPAGTEFPRYSDAEYAARWQGVRALLDQAGTKVALIAGHGAGRAEIQHLTNAPVRWESLLVFPADPGIEPRLLLQLDNHAAGTRPWSIVPVAVAGPDLAAAAVEMVSSIAGPGGPVAILGPISDRLSGAIRSRLGDSDVVSLGPAYGRSRVVKSDEELRWTRYGAAICDHAVSSFLREAHPGLREDELGAIMTGAVAEAGGQLGICFLATSSMTEGGSPAPRQTWSRRRTTPDDLVMFELSAGFGGATGQVLRTISLGDEPSGIVARLHDVAESVYAEIAGAIRPGLPVRELERLGGAIEEVGMTIVDDLVHGYGGGYLPPHVRTPATRREDPGDAELVVGQLLVVQPNVATPDHRFGVQTGDLLVVTADGAAPLHTSPRGLLRLAGAA